MVQTRVGHGASYKWDIARQCIRATSISVIHMPDDIMSSIKIFADDTKAYKDVQTEEDMLTLQKHVYSLCDRSLQWQLNFNASKCSKHIYMTYGNPKIKSKYKMKETDGNLTDIRHDDEVEKDLGVRFDRK